jgi:tetratricopeptide (TPR) repeat protein
MRVRLRRSGLPPDPARSERPSFLTVAGLTVLAGLLLGGCATVRKAPLPVASSLLVVVEDAPTSAAAEAREAAAVRALSTVPVRAYPSDADADLRADLAAGPVAERIDRARTRAAELRLPWILVLGADGARLETAHRGELRWLSRGRRTDAHALESFERAMRGRPGGVAGPPRLAPPERLAQVRASLAAGRFEAWTAAVELLAVEFPADPAVRTHVGLQAHLLRGGAPADGLELARSMAVDSESELLAIALEAEATGDLGLASKVWDALVSLFPHRLDYHLGRSEVLDALQEPEQALAACRRGLREADRDAILTIDKGTAPDEAPLALPFADLAYCVGYYLFESQRWELAAVAYEDAIRLYEAADRFRELGEALNNAGVAMVQAERPLIGARTLRKAVDVRLELGHRLPLANSRYNLGRALDEAGRPGAARLSLDRAAGDYRAAGEVHEALEVQIEILDLLVQEDDRAGFDERASSILGRLDEQPSSPEIESLKGDAWFEIGAGRMEFHDAEGSLAAYFRSLRVWQALGRALEEGQTRYSMALPNLALLKFDDSWWDLIAAMEISVDLGDSSSILAIRDQLDQIQDLMEQGGQAPPEVPEPLRRWVEPPGR